MSAADPGVIQRLGELVYEVKPMLRERSLYIGPESRLQSDLGLASVEIIDLLVAAEEVFDVVIPDDQTEALLDATLAELAEMLPPGPVGSAAGPAGDRG